MIDKDGNKVKSVFKEMRLDEISAVDRPAQPGATMSIMKRAAVALGLAKAEKPADEEEAMEAEDEGEEKKPKKGKNPFASATKRALLTTPTDGHQHLLSDEVGPDMRASGGQTGIEQDAEGNFHSHPWMIDPSSGSVVIGMANGHDHQVLMTSQGGAPPAILDLSKQAAADVPDVAEASTSSGVPADSVGTVPNEATMSDTNDQTVDQAVAKQLEEAQARVERAEAVAELSDAQRGIFKSLDEDAQTAFLALSPEQREGEVAKAADANAVVEVIDGVEYRKSDDPRLIQLAKSAAAEKALRLESEARAAEGDLRKRAEALSGLPGTVEVRMSILKGIDALPEADRGPALEALSAQNEQMAKAFQSHGTTAVPSSVNELDAIAKRLRDADPSLSPEQAMAKALNTPEGAAAYDRSIA